MVNQIEVEVDKLLMVVYESKFDEKQRQDLISYIDGVLMDLSHHLDVDTFEKNLHSIYQRIRHTFYQFITVDVQVFEFPENYLKNREIFWRIL